MRAWCIVLGLALGGCKREPCDRFAELVEQCLAPMPAATLQELRLVCAEAQRAPRNRASPFDGIAECSSTQTCDELKACFERRGCAFVFSGPDDAAPSMMCR